MKWIATLVLVGMASVASADAQSPDEEVGRREYAAGVVAYDRGDYPVALGRFTAAKEARPLPAFDFNIARCLDRLGRWHEAADAYERFLAAKPDAPNAAELRTRMSELRARRGDTGAAVGERVPATVSREIEPPPRGAPRPRLRLAAGLVLGGAVLAGVAGGVLYGTTYHDFTQRRASCHDQCAPIETQAFRDSVNGRVIGAGVLWGVAGVALVADVALWIVDSKQHRALAHLDGGSVTF